MRRNWGGLAASVKQAEDDATVAASADIASLVGSIAKLNDAILMVKKKLDEPATPAVTPVSDLVNKIKGLKASQSFTATIGTVTVAPPASLHGKFVAVRRPETKAEEAVVHNGVARQDQRTKLVAAEVVIASESFAVGDTVYFKPEALRTQGTSTLILPAHGTEPEVVFVWMPEAAVIVCRRVGGARDLKLGGSGTSQPYVPSPWPGPPSITWGVTNDVKN